MYRLLLKVLVEHVYINKDLGVDATADKRLYVVSDYESAQEKDVSLIKCTPYIKSSVIIDTNTNKEIPNPDIK